MFLPVASSRGYPNTNSAPRFQYRIVASGESAIRASGEFSTRRAENIESGEFMPVLLHLPVCSVTPRGGPGCPSGQIMTLHGTLWKGENVGVTERCSNEKLLPD